MPTQVKDCTPLLKEVIAEAREAGLVVAADDLERSAFAAFTSSSELLGEQGVAIRRFLKATRGNLPAGTKDKLETYLMEINIVWPGWRKMFALFRRRRHHGQD